MKQAHRTLIALLWLVLLIAPHALSQRQTPPDTAEIKHFRIRSELLSAFWGRDMFVEAGVVLPPDRKADEHPPLCIDIHGFGGSHRSAWGRGKRLVEGMRTGEVPRMIYVFPNAQFSLGHHEFADSVNNGPWGRAFVEEFLPALERTFHGGGSARARFLTGHSSGGWSSFWLQITWPEVFGGTWSTAPDPVDFRDFTGINIYEDENAYEDARGNPVMLVRRRGRFVMSIEDFVRSEVARRPYGGQFASFDAVFSPRGEDGRPMPLFDRKTGKIDRFVARAWERYDIRLVLERKWKTLGPALRGKLRIWIGTQDTFRLEGAVKLLAESLRKLGSDAEILLVEGRDHGSLFRPHETLWPLGMMHRIHQEMWREHLSHRDR